MDENELIKKWLADELTETELEDFKKLDDYDLHNEISENTKYFKASNISTPKDYANFKSKLKDKKIPVIKLSSYKLLFRVAALFVISLSVYFAFFFNNLTTFQTIASQKTTFELPDASSVILNADSEAKYNKKKWADKREISLDGEAFFKVAKGSKFDVITSTGTVSVLGTQFNVKNRTDYFEVKCFEGIVGIESKGTTHKLTKGKTYRIIKGNMLLDSINFELPKWIDNISSFKSVPFYEVLNEFERQYNISITTQNVNTKRLFTGGFAHTNLEEALMAITAPLELNFKKDNDSNKIIISGIK